MSIKLTHDQAALLRSVNAHVVIYIGGPIIGDWDASAYIEEYCGSAPAELTPIGREALAEYNRENATVPKDDIEVALRLVRLCMNSFIEKGMNNQDREALARLQAALEGK